MVMTPSWREASRASPVTGAYSWSIAWHTHTPPQMSCGRCRTIGPEIAIHARRRLVNTGTGAWGPLNREACEPRPRVGPPRTAFDQIFLAEVSPGRVVRQRADVHPGQEPVAFKSLPSKGDVYEQRVASSYRNHSPRAFPVD